MKFNMSELMAQIQQPTMKPPALVLVKLCEMCHGSGYMSIRNGEDYIDCPRCKGTGKRN